MSPSSTLQSTLHALSLLTPFKYLSFAPDGPRKRAPEEVLKPGALYAECAVARIRIPKTTLAPPSAEEKTDGGGDGKTPGGGTTTPDDGELGGIGLGMEVWVIMSGSARCGKPQRLPRKQTQVPRFISISVVLVRLLRIRDAALSNVITARGLIRPTRIL
jgi:hypothetical protein